MARINSRPKSQVIDRPTALIEATKQTWHARPLATYESPVFRRGQLGSSPPPREPSACLRRGQGRDRAQQGHLLQCNTSNVARPRICGTVRTPCPGKVSGRRRARREVGIDAVRSDMDPGQSPTKHQHRAVLQEAEAREPGHFGLEGAKAENTGTASSSQQER